jgi:hypothetical protein
MELYQSSIFIYNKSDIGKTKKDAIKLIKNPFTHELLFNVLQYSFSIHNERNRMISMTSNKKYDLMNEKFEDVFDINIFSNENYIKINDGIGDIHSIRFIINKIINRENILHMNPLCCIFWYYESLLNYNENNKVDYNKESNILNLYHICTIIIKWFGLRYMCFKFILNSLLIVIRHITLQSEYIKLDCEEGVPQSA